MKRRMSCYGNIAVRRSRMILRFVSSCQKYRHQPDSRVSLFMDSPRGTVCHLFYVTTAYHHVTNVPFPTLPVTDSIRCQCGVICDLGLFASNFKLHCFRKTNKIVKSQTNRIKLRQNNFNGLSIILENLNKN